MKAAGEQDGIDVRMPVGEMRIPDPGIAFKWARGFHDPSRFVMKNKVGSLETVPKIGLGDLLRTYAFGNGKEQENPDKILQNKWAQHIHGQ
jgi:hypothetical protein